jgi:hypothetical protein
VAPHEGLRRQAAEQGSRARHVHAPIVACAIISA